MELQSEQRRSSSGGQDNRRSVTHELATIETGGNLQVTAGGDLTVRGATVEAGGDATLYAVGDTTIESVQDRRWSATRQGSDRRTETSTETQRTTIRAGGELTVGARTGDVTLDAVSLASGGDTNLVAEQGTVLLLTETDEAGTTSSRRRTSRLEWSETNQGRSEETIEHVELEYGGELRISAGEGVVVEYERDGSLAASLNELTGSPELAWMDELRGDANVEWQGVEADSESWYRSSSGLTAAGRAAAAREEQRRRLAAAAAAEQAAAAKAADNQPSDPGAEDPGVPDMPELYDADVSFGTRRAQSVAGVQGAPREWRPPPPETGSRSGSGSFQGGTTGRTTGGADPSTVTLHTVDITEPAPLPHDPYAPWLFGTYYSTPPSESETSETETQTVTLGDAEIEVPASDSDADGYETEDGYLDFGFGYWDDPDTSDSGDSNGRDPSEHHGGTRTDTTQDEQEDERQRSLCEVLGIFALFGCGDPGMELEPNQFVDQTDDQQVDQQHVQLEEHFTISICFPLMPCWWEQGRTIVFVDRDDDTSNPDEAEEAAGNRSPWDDLPPTPDPEDVAEAVNEALQEAESAITSDPTISTNRINPDVPRPDLPSSDVFGGQKFQHWGRNVVRWGTGPQGAINRIDELSHSTVSELGITSSQAEVARDFYAAVASRDAGNLAAVARVRLMEHILQILGE